ncbi:MAG: thioredoxin-disulfide reductase [Epsilonproteobacteria bacterium]|nr:thioredoxin-disulfide reductase [Campylobacterota bacterium]
MVDVAIIGAGPAGLSAGLYASRMGLKSVIFEKLTPGGQITLSSEIENYPGVCDVKSGLELMQCWPNQAQKFGCEIVSHEVKSITKENDIFQIALDDTLQQAKAVIVATGASPKRAGFDNEEKFLGKGISTCAVCDGFFYRNQEVAVIGGGDTALEEALYLSSIASKVYLIHRRDKFRAAPATVNRVLQNPKIEILYNSVVQEAYGEDFVEGIKVNKAGELVDLKLPGVFVFVGNTKNTQILKNGDEFICKMCDDGSVCVDLNMNTSLQGLFAVGDIRSQAKKQVVCAAADGAVAALEAVRYLDK